MKTEFDLPEDRLATTDETGRRVFLYPADVKGFFKKKKKIVHFILMIFFLVLPWIKIGGYQSILLDIPHRRFAILGITFWAHDVPMLIFVFGTIFIGIALITALFGRVWCGWACPETVFIESVYRRIERWVEGDSFTRRKRDKGPVNFEFIRAKLIKWTLFLAVTLIITHSFLAYFVGTEKLLQMIQRSPFEHPTSFLFMAASTFILLVAFGWFREQFCIIACPYGRFQSVLMDEHSLIVTYDEKRGEPRRGIAEDKNIQGDCVNCYRCVQVCPTGIDIRRGVQMECVACTACIDACDEVMAKVKKPPGLIRYDTETGLKGSKPKYLRPRVIIYSFLLLIVLAGLTFTLVSRDSISITILKTRGEPYKTVSPTEIVNQFNLSISNQSFDPALLKLRLPEETPAKLAIQTSEIKIMPGKDFHGGFFIEFPKSLLVKGSADIDMYITYGEKIRKETLHVVGPF